MKSQTPLQSISNTIFPPKLPKKKEKKKDFNCEPQLEFKFSDDGKRGYRLEKEGSWRDIVGEDGKSRDRSGEEEKEKKRELN